MLNVHKYQHLKAQAEEKKIFTELLQVISHSLLFFKTVVGILELSLFMIDSGKPIMPAILFGYLVSAYIFSGLICWLAFLKNLNQLCKLSGWKRLLAVLASFVIVVFWPTWIVIEIKS